MNNPHSSSRTSTWNDCIKHRSKHAAHVFHRESLQSFLCDVKESIQRGEQQLVPQSQRTELTIKQRKLSVEPTGVLHCLSCVTALKGEHATHCGEPDCSGVIDQLPGVIPRYRVAETNAGKNTLNLLSPLSSRWQGESSPFPQAKPLNAGMQLLHTFSC